MGLNTVYRSSGEGAIASFNFNDIASGTGSTIFNLIVQYDGSALKHSLSNNSILSTGNQSIAAGGTFNYDTTPLKLSRVIDGIVRVNLVWQVFKSATTGPSFSAGGFLTIQLQKWDGTTATNLGSSIDTVTVTTPSAASSGHYVSRNSSIIISDVPRTKIKKGEMIRLNIVSTNVEGFSNITGHNIAGNPLGGDITNMALITTDPTTGSNGTAIYTTNSTISIPFDIDV